MGAKPTDPTEPIRLRASRFPMVDEGTACTQSSFKVGKKAFLFIGMQGGGYKAMFKLQTSLLEATKLAKKEPDRFHVGSTAWVTARFTADDPLPQKLWMKWLDESYKLSAATSRSKKKPTKTVSKKTASKKTKKVANRKKSTKRTKKQNHTTRKSR